MALIKCPECGNEISDKAAACPNCGYPIDGKPIAPVESSEPVKEVDPAATDSAENTAEAEPCAEEKKAPDLAEENPVSQAPAPAAKQERSRTSIVIAIIAAAVLVIAAILISGAVRDAKEKKAEEAAAAAEAEAREEYISNLSAIRVNMLTTGAKAEEMANLVHDVWYNTIYEESDESTNKYCIQSSRYKASKTFYSDSDFNSDFNTSLAALFTDPTYISDAATVESEVSDITELYGKLQNPPEDLSGCYAVLGDMYDAFMDLAGCATDPSGNLSSYTSTFNDADSDFIDCYEKLGAMIPSEPVDSTAE